MRRPALVTVRPFVPETDKVKQDPGPETLHVSLRYLDRDFLSRLSALRYLDDRAYAVRWLEATLARRPMGRDRLRSELMARGLDEALADQAIDEGLDGMDEDLLARRALTLHRHGGRLSRRRMVFLLRQRGFGEETIERIISDCPGEERPT